MVSWSVLSVFVSEKGARLMGIGRAPFRSLVPSASTLPSCLRSLMSAGKAATPQRWIAPHCRAFASGYARR